MASKTTNYGLNKHSPQDFYNVEARNENWDKIDETLAATDPTKITDKAEPADGDGVMIADSADGGKAKRLLWSNVKAALGKLFVPLARKINGKTLAKDVTLTAADIKMPNSEEDVGAAMAKFRQHESHSFALLLRQKKPHFLVCESIYIRDRYSRPPKGNYALLVTYGLRGETNRLFAIFYSIPIVKIRYLQNSYMQLQCGVVRLYHP